MIPDEPAFLRNQRKKPHSNKELIDRCLRKFNKALKQEADCIEAIVQSLGSAAKTCQHCGSVRVSRRYGQRVLRCNACHQRTWILAKTFFGRLKKVRPWLMAIWLMEDGAHLSGGELHRRARISDSSAQSIVKKLSMVVHQAMGKGAELIASLRFLVLFCKRSSETPAQEHPTAEEKGGLSKNRAAKENHARSPSTARSPAGVSASYVTAKVQKNRTPCKLADTAQVDQLTTDEREVYDVLSDQPIYFDTLCNRVTVPINELNVALLNLELAGLAQRTAGHHYIRNCLYEDLSTGEPEETDPDASAAESSLEMKQYVDFIRRTFHGISRKYLQIYLALHWCYVDREAWSCGRLMTECLRFGPLVFKRIRAYVSPSMVQVRAVGLRD